MNTKSDLALEDAVSFFFMIHASSEVSSHTQSLSQQMVPAKQSKMTSSSFKHTGKIILRLDEFGSDPNPNELSQCLIMQSPLRYPKLNYT